MSNIPAPVDATATPEWAALKAHHDQLVADHFNLKDAFAAALAGLAMASAIPSDTGWQALQMLPALLLGLWLGQQLFLRIEAEQAARFTQWLLLLLAGTGLLGRAWS